MTKFPTVFYKFDQIQLLRMWRINSQGQDSSVSLGQTKNFGEIRVNEYTANELVKEEGELIV